MSNLKWYDKHFKYPFCFWDIFFCGINQIVTWNFGNWIHYEAHMDSFSLSVQDELSLMDYNKTISYVQVLNIHTYNLLFDKRIYLKPTKNKTKKIKTKN